MLGQLKDTMGTMKEKMVENAKFWAELAEPLVNPDTIDAVNDICPTPSQS